MPIKDYYKGFGDEQIEQYRQEVRQRWGEKTLHESEQRVLKMGRDKFEALQVESGNIFQTISDNIPAGYDSDIVQAQVSEWRRWLENFHHYTDEAVLGLGRAYSGTPNSPSSFGNTTRTCPNS